MIYKINIDKKCVEFKNALLNVTFTFVLSNKNKNI